MTPGEGHLEKDTRRRLHLLSTPGHLNTWPTPAPTSDSEVIEKDRTNVYKMAEEGDTWTSTTTYTWTPTLTTYTWTPTNYTWTPGLLLLTSWRWWLGGKRLPPQTQVMLTCLLFPVNGHELLIALPSSGCCSSPERRSTTTQA